MNFLKLFMNKTTLRLINFILFQFGWLACVKSGAQGVLWIAPVAIAPVLVWHFYIIKNRKTELRLILIGSLLGSLLDQVLLMTGWLVYPDSAWPSWMLPPWMVALWLVFCTTLNLSLSWLQNRLYLATAIGVIGGPLTYWAGAKLGAVVWFKPLYVSGFLAAEWGMLIPFLLWLANQKNIEIRN
jgi:hypothetical protein